MFESLTKYIDILKPGNYGEYINPKINENGETVIQGVQYSKDVHMFEETVNGFISSHPEFQHINYEKIKKENNIKYLDDPLLYSQKLPNLDIKTIFIIINLIIHSERFCTGAILSSLENGYIQKCLEEIKKKDTYYISDNIKEISIASSYFFMSFNDNYYKDLLRISEHWISYRRNNTRTNEIVTEWSYKTSKPNNFWKSLTEDIFEVYSKQFYTFITDVPTFNIRVTFENNKHWDLELFSSFKDNELQHIASLIKQLIPNTEIDYPNVLDEIPLFLHKHLMVKKELLNLEKDNICALMYAEGGAMGSPGETCIIDTNGNKYSCSGLYDKECDLSQIEVIETYFTGLNHLDIGHTDYMECSINDKEWKYISLGFGNHLFLREDFWLEHGDRINNVKRSIRYKNWKTLIKE